MPKSNCIYIFLDEGGDFNFSSNGTKYFTLTTVTMSEPIVFDIPLLDYKYKLLQEELDIEYFHASENVQNIRDKVFSIIKENISSLRVDSLIVEKSKTSPSLQNPLKFYPKMFGFLLQYLFRSIEIQVDSFEAIIITDKIPLQKKRHAIIKTIKTNLHTMLPSKAKYVIYHHDSKSSGGLQITDFCNWAVYRKWSRDDMRSYNIIKEAVKIEYDIFFDSRKHFY